VRTTVESENNQPYLVSDCDLLQRNVSAVETNEMTLYFESGTAGALAYLTDGITGAGNKENAFTPSGGSVTYTLDTALAPAGYDITGFDSYTGWQDGGRVDQNYVVSFRKLGSDTFANAITNTYASGMKETRISLTDLNLSGIDAVRITFLSQENSGVGYKELDLSGAPPAYTEVTRRDSGAQVIASNDTASVLISEGEGTPGALAVDSPVTVIDTLTQGATEDAAALDLAGRTLALNGLFLRPGAGGLTVTNGTLAGARSPLVVGNWSGSDAVLCAAVTNLADAGLLLKTGTGTLTLSGTNGSPGGTEVAAGALRLVGNGSLGSGYVNIHDGALQIDGGIVNPATSNSLRLCFVNAALNQTAGSLSYSGYLQAQNTALNLSGGSSYIGTDALLGWGGTNTTVTISGSHTANWRIARFSSGAVNLYLQNGGKLYTDRIYSSVGATGSVFFAGGTLGVSSIYPTLSSGDWIGVSSGYMTLYVQDGGAIIDTANGSVTIKRPFLRDGASTGGLTKTGANTLTLMITNDNTFCTYAGGTAVSAGTLKLWPSTSPLPANTRLTVAYGAYLDMNGATQTVDEVTGEGRIYNSSLSNAVLTVGGDSTATNFEGVIDGAVSLVKAGTGTWSAIQLC